MNKVFTPIAIATFSVASVALAHQPGQSAMNQNGFGKVIAQLRCMWKQSCTKPITEPLNRGIVRAKDKHEH